jgi:hypothetical protein
MRNQFLREYRQFIFPSLKLPVPRCERTLAPAAVRITQHGQQDAFAVPQGGQAEDHRTGMKEAKIVR